MPARHGTDALASRIALRDNRSLDLRRPVTALARAREHLEPLRALAQRIITRDYHSSSALPPDQGAKTRRSASGTPGGVAAPLPTERPLRNALRPNADCRHAAILWTAAIGTWRPTVNRTTFAWQG